MRVHSFPLPLPACQCLDDPHWLHLSRHWPSNDVTGSGVRDGWVIMGCPQSETSAAAVEVRLGDFCGPRPREHLFPQWGYSVGSQRVAPSLPL